MVRTFDFMNRHFEFRIQDILLLNNSFYIVLLLLLLILTGSEYFLHSRAFVYSFMWAIVYTVNCVYNGGVSTVRTPVVVVDPAD